MYEDTYVIVPVLNEAKVLEPVLTGLKKQFAHIVCVDDGSTDDSAKIITKLGITLLSHPRNLGQGAAFRTGLQYALRQKGARFFITFDADGQHRTQDAAAMREYIQRQKLDIVMGSRFLGEAPGMTFVKRVVLRLAIKFTHIFTALPLTDTHNGLRVFNRRFAKKLNIKFGGMAHASEIELAVARTHATYAEFPVTIIYSKYSRSKGQSVFNGFAILWDLLSQRVKDRYSES